MTKLATAEYHQLFGLWASNSDSKVKFTSHVNKDILIPKDSKILVFKGGYDGTNNRPMFNLVFTKK